MQHILWANMNIISEITSDTDYKHLLYLRNDYTSKYDCALE